MPDQNQSGGANLNSGGDTNVGGDVVGRDKTITTTTTSTTTVNEGGPTARYAVIGLVVVAALAIIVVAVIAFGGNPPTVPSPTPSATATVPAVVIRPSDTPTVAEPSRTPEPTFALASSPTATETLPPTSTPTFSPVPPTATDTPNPRATATATEIPSQTPSPTPTSSLPVYDNFNNNCLDADKWALKVDPVGAETPTPTPVPVQGNCLDTEQQFFTEGQDGYLSVFLTLEGDQTHNLIEKANACYQEVEVTLALDNVAVISDKSNIHTSYLNVGLWLTRASGSNGFFEVRVEAGNASGQLAAQVTSRWTIPDGPLNLESRPYTFGQPITVAFRVKDVGTKVGNLGVTSENKKITAYVDGQQIGQPFSMLTACGLTLGYHADAPTQLDGYFDEVRLTPLP